MLPYKRIRSGSRIYLYLKEIHDACMSGQKSKYTTLRTLDDLAANCRINCIPADFKDMSSDDYDRFLEERRILMARKIKEYFDSL